MMQKIPKEQILARMKIENPWWESPETVRDEFALYCPRAYFKAFRTLVCDGRIRRAVVLMGPRRVGKTVLLHQLAVDLMAQGIEPKQICYLSVDHPIYNGLRLDELLSLYWEIGGRLGTGQVQYIFFDGIQYLRDWETHLKHLVDDHKDIRFVASGSAAAALKFKSMESGAGRFTDFLLPPLTFQEYLMLLDKELLIEVSGEEDGPIVARGLKCTAIEELNECFVDYLNFGGYPEVVLSDAIRSDPQRFIKSDIIDKVLLRDLPSLYGISDVQELNSLFTMLAYNSAHEVSLNELSQNSGVAKNTIKRYIEYLEAAFLIKIVHRVDRSGKRFKRANFFKVYLTNPSIRAALFSPARADDKAMGGLAETAVFSQWFHSSDEDSLHYARWNKGEVDLVCTAGGLVSWAVEVKWSDRYLDSPGELKSLIQFCEINNVSYVAVTTRTQWGMRTVGNVTIDFVPASIYAYAVGRNLVRERGFSSSEGDVLD